MSRQARLQPSTSALQQAHGHAHIPDRPLKGWRTVRELRDELRFSSDDACRVWLRRQGIASVKRGRVILVDGLDVDAALRKVS